MFKYNNTHIFTGYLKQLLASFNLPTCKIYTQEFTRYLEQNGREDPRVLRSFDPFYKDYKAIYPAVRIDYLRNNELYNYYWTHANREALPSKEATSWKRSSEIYYSSDKKVPGLTKTLNSPGINYDTQTHEYLGDYLRFLRDYYNINLMSLYNCFTNKIYNNIYYKHKIKVLNINYDDSIPEGIGNEQFITSYSSFDSRDPNYRIYGLPVKLFAEYTIAIDCDQGVELFCGLYNTNLEVLKKAENLAARTYQKVPKTLFSQPFLYDKLKVDYWPETADFKQAEGSARLRTDVYTRWELANREKDLKLFIKVPATCRSTITILEGDFRTFNDAQYEPQNGILTYKNNHSILNFNTTKVKSASDNKGDGIDLNNYPFKPISRLQLLALNTGESSPFADRLVEYLSGSAILPIDEIPDNIKRIQRVMNQNNYYFRIEGLWENKMQNILYDYIMSSGPVIVNTSGKLEDKHQGYHARLGHTSKSTLYDILGYVDKDTEKWYSSWKKENNKAKIKTNIQNVDIYEGLYDIK